MLTEVTRRQEKIQNVWVQRIDSHLVHELYAGVPPQNLPDARHYDRPLEGAADDGIHSALNGTRQELRPTVSQR